jgi:hypothetical protein
MDWNEQTQQKFDEWVVRNTAQNARLDELLLPKFRMCRGTIREVLNILVAHWGDKVDSIGIREVGGYLDMLDNDDLSDQFNTCSVVFSFYARLKKSDDVVLQMLATKLLFPIKTIMAGIREYQAENEIPRMYSSKDLDKERGAAREVFGSDLLGVEHLFCKGIIDKYTKYVTPSRMAQR